MRPTTNGGINVAMKIPKSQYDKAVAFYRDILNFDVAEKTATNMAVSRTHEVKFGACTLRLDCVDNMPGEMEVQRI